MTDLKKLLEPTEEMIEAFHKAWPYSSVIGADTIHEIYKAMIAKSETTPKLLAVVVAGKALLKWNGNPASTGEEGDVVYDALDEAIEALEE